MAVQRVSGTFGSDERTRGNGRPNTIFLHVDSADTDAEVLLRFQQFEALMNAKLATVSRTIHGPDYTDLPEGLPGNLVKVLLKNPDTGATEQVSWVFGQPTATEAMIKAAFGPVTGASDLLNQYGVTIGDPIRVTQSPLSLE